MGKGSPEEQRRGKDVKLHNNISSVYCVAVSLVLSVLVSSIIGKEKKEYIRRTTIPDLVRG